MNQEPLNPYSVPKADLVAVDLEDTSMAQPTATTRYASGMLFIAGGTALALGLQTFGNTATGWVNMVVLAMLLLGAITFVSGGWVMKMRSLGAYLGTVCTLQLTLGGAAWLLLSFSVGYFSLLAMLLPAVSLIACIFAAASIRPTRAADKVRRHLMAD